MSVQVEPALDIIEKKLQKDHTLAPRIQLTTQFIIEIPGFYLHSTYFLFQGKHYEQVESTTMVSPVSPILANVYIEFLEEKLL